MDLRDEVLKFGKGKKTPFLVIDPSIIRENYRRICKAFKGAGVFYAIKANPDPGILEILQDIGSGFEVASTQELELIFDIGAPPSSIITSHPIKTPEFISKAYENKIGVFVFDSKTEINKIAEYAPESKVSVRLSVSNVGSEWPLAEKFGLDLKK